MKNLKALIFISLLISFSSCEKEKPLNIILYHQPLEVIQSYIHGKWKLLYMKGGLSGVDIIRIDTCQITFTEDNRYLFQVNNGPYLINQTIGWEKGVDSYVSSDSIWLMNISTQLHSVVEILSDTLIYHHTLIDGYSYYLLKTD